MVPPSGNYQVALTQISNIQGGSEPEYPGTNAVAGDLGWADYRLTVRVRGDGEGILGILLRYIDADNYYRFSMGPNYRRLISKVAGEVTVLWEDSEIYTLGREDRLPAGTSVQVLAGNAEDAPADEAVVVRRFAAALDERGHLP